MERDFRSVERELFVFFLTLSITFRAEIFTYFSMGEGNEMIFFRNNKQPKKYVGVSDHSAINSNNFLLFYDFLRNLFILKSRTGAERSGSRAKRELE